MTLLEGEYEPSPSEWVREQVAAYEASGGKEADKLPGTDDKIIVITSVGAKSGKLRKNPVMRVEKEGTYVAIASKGGAPENPSWYANFVAHPRVDVQDGAEVRPYRARLVTGDERTKWWAHAVATWPTYAEYQEKTDRQIPVFVLEPVTD
ncbi:nitroreductase family deazaflavin-dependent oxidoreductase [Nocardioides sp. zg-536]|uniref:Nitroreductase family deazaflavin-dependent oxidoreductase n=1 Tax=Nocardioides faecalis TaxID=2803858 RepID=A0A938Y3L8_9ACTN|nr:nitroreductase family deazaflavin-dependent oxidoreductase [Nocardioides faecalis]MBM9458654.1 nitroreductase family deazaflavin-dependent oxidoreductase [Nocardioides faecalis]MBS4752986.1 nitroreductase family deazaflavin-dependent oxidoreductase [Nocardioides faecalis]QVI58649.1 nitroreductase family deazaflavin-dependent oxidoreductase [Nocardioides faecalis]